MQKMLALRKKTRALWFIEYIGIPLRRKWDCKKGDIILAINEKPVKEPEDATRMIRSIKPGEKISILYWRLKQGKGC